MFDIGAMEFLMLGILALFIFGPEKLPDVARQAARGLRTVRAMAANARRDFGKELGPEFENLDLADLNPRRFVRKHLLDDIGKDVTIDKDDLSVDLDGKSSASRKKTSANGTSTKTAEEATKTADDSEVLDAEAAEVVESLDGGEVLNGTIDGVEVADGVEPEAPSRVALLVRQAPPPFDYEAT